MTTRYRLPARREARTFDFNHGYRTYTATLGFYNDGGLGELFITCTKAGSDAQIVANEAAVLVSIALQHGADVESMADAMPRNEDGSPQGVMGAALDAVLKFVPADEPDMVPA